MPIAKLATKLGEHAEAGLQPHTAELYRDPGRRIVAVVELRATERTEVVADSEVGGTPTVKLAITSLEVANPRQEDALRRAMEAIYLGRTAYGTLDESGQIALSDETIELTGGEVVTVEMARLAAAVRYYEQAAHEAQSVTDPAVMRKFIRGLAKGLRAVRDGGELADDE